MNYIFESRGYIEPGVVSSVEPKMVIMMMMMMIVTTLQTDKNNILCWEQRYVMYGITKLV
jgi:hypothetical protein